MSPRKRRTDGSAPLRSAAADGIPTESRTEQVQNVGVALISVLLCLCAVFLFAKYFAMPTERIAYPLENGVNGYDPFVQQFDALKKGQTWIDWEADPRLDTLENVYDYNERTAAGLYYLWDRAYYNGKFYSYFGIAPVITFYMPYYALTGALPATGTVMAFFVLIAAVFLPLALCLWRRIFAPDVPHWVLIAATQALFTGSLILLIARGRTPFYFVVCVSALAFLSLFLFLCLLGYLQRGRIARYACYVGAGIAYGLLFQSRTVTALAAAFLVLPGLWFFLIARPRQEKGKERILRVLGELLSLGVPVALFFCGSMIFNAMRFSGPLDFGNNYNLTVADVSTYKVRLSDIPFALFHYLLDIPAKAETYPYLTFSYIKFSNYGHYLYRDAGFGLFAVPAAACMLLSPAVIFSDRHRASRRVFSLSALAAVLVIPWLDFCLGGVIYRYLCDFSLIAALFGILTLLSLCERADASLRPRHPIAARLPYVLVTVFFLFSAYVSLRLCLINHNPNVMEYGEEIEAALTRVLPYR